MSARRVTWVLFVLLAMLGSLSVAGAETYAFVTKWSIPATGLEEESYPAGVALDASGHVYVAACANNCIQKFTASGGSITKWGSGGSGNGQFCIPRGVAIDGSGNVYVADTQNHRVQKFTSSGGFITKWGSWGTGNGQFKWPHGIAVDASGHVYVVEKENHRVQKFTANGAFISKWGSWGTGNGQFRYPQGIAVSASGSVYVVDSGNHRVQKFTSSGAYLTQWGGTTSSDDQQLHYPMRVEVDGAGNVYVSEHTANQIQKFTSNGVFLAKWGSAGTGNGQFDHPDGVAVNAAGRVYVADSNNSRVQKFACVDAKLAWVGDTGFVSDGVDPDSGAVGSAFRFRVKYTGPSPEHVRLLLYRDGVPHPLNPFVMIAGRGTPTTGQVFYLRKTLNQDCAWSYQFEALANGVLATGPPTEVRSGPFVGTPSLAWVGDTGFVSDGVDPDSGPVGDSFRFRVKYTGPAPEYVRLLLYRDGVAHPNNPFTLIAGKGSPSTGQVFYLRKTLNQDCAWSYKFKARAAGVLATGPPTAVKNGPFVGSPSLAWVGDTGFVSDGVDPNSGAVGDSFRFRVKYTGPEPDYVRLLLYRDGVAHPLNPFALIAGKGSPATGQVFYLRKTLNQDCTWSCKFKARANGVMATGAPTAVKSGPTVSSKSAGVMVSTLSCSPTAVGAQMTFTLSADASVTCEVLNIAGRAVKTIVLDRPMTKGIKSLTWDGRNAAGLRVPGGMYLVRMTATGTNGSRWTSMGTLNLTR